MYYATFYQLGVLSGAPIEAVGDRSVIVLDGRESRRAHHAIAADEARVRGYVGYRLHKGRTLATTPTKSLGYVDVRGRTDLETISERYNARHLKG